MNDLRVVMPNQYDYAISTSTNMPLMASGVDNLVQIIVKSIKTSPGRDLFNPTYGMGLRDILPSVASQVTEQQARSQVAQGLMKISEEIKNEQTGVNLEAEAKLASLDLLDVTFDMEQGLWDVTIQVTSVSGEAATVSLTT